MLYLRNPMFNVLTTEEADALHARMMSAYQRAGDLFASNKFDAIRMRGEMAELCRDLEIAGWV
jgi:hypothetical protein